MPTYLFFPSREDGSALMFEVHDCRDDADALARAEMVLRAHRSAVEVAVWEHERPVGTRGRSAVR